MINGCGNFIDQIWHTAKPTQPDPYKTWTEEKPGLETRIYL